MKPERRIIRNGDTFHSPTLPGEYFVYGSKGATDLVMRAVEGRGPEDHVVVPIAVVLSEWRPLERNYRGSVAWIEPTGGKA